MNDQWHHICILWEGAADSGYTSYYRDGAEVKFQPCSVGTRNAGGALQIGGGGRTENVGIKGFNLWNRILTESEIVEEANTYDRGMRYGWSHCEVEVVVQEVTQEEFY